MGDLSDLSSDMRSAAADVPAFTDRLAVTLSNNAKAAIEGRIRGRNDGQGKNIGGIDSRGIPLKPYSPAYAALKTRKGRNKGFTDLDFTGDMWNNTGTIISTGGRDGFEATIAGRTKETQEKLDANTDRYGNVLAQSDQEVEELQLDLDEEIELFLKHHNLA